MTMKKMSRILSVFLALALLCSLCAVTPVFAEEGTAADSTPAATDAQPQDDVALATLAGLKITSIDSYQIGTKGEQSDFAPATTITLYQSELMLKVYFTYSYTDSDGTLGDSDVKVTLSGDNFVQQNSKITASGTKGQGIVEINNIKYNGPSNALKVTIADAAGANGADGNFTISECQLPEPTPAPTPVPTAEPTPEPTATPQPKTPGLILKETNFGGTSVAAGEPFDLTLTIYATDGGENLSDVMVTLGINDENVTLANGNLNVYLGEMAPGSTRQVTYKILPGANFTGGVAKFSVGLSGKGKNTGAAPTTDGSTSVSVPVTQPDRFEITGLEAPETMMVGEEGYLSLSFVNKGKMQINNLSAELKGNMANPGQSQYLGNLAAGTENSVDFSLMANEAGTIEGTIVLSYEDAQGEIITLEKTFSCTVEENMGGGDIWIDPGMDPTMGGEVEEPSGGVPVFVWIILAVVVIGGGVAAVVIVRKKKAAKLAQLEDSDEDI